MCRCPHHQAGGQEPTNDGTGLPSIEPHSLRPPGEGHGDPVPTSAHVPGVSIHDGLDAGCEPGKVTTEVFEICWELEGE